MSDATGIPSAETAPKRRSWLAAFFIRLVKEKPLGTASGIIILIWIVIAIFADALTPYPPFEMHLADRLQGSSAQYLLGTDHIGRDFLSRLILGARSSILIGLAATALSTVISTLIGGTSGFLGGKFDIIVQRVVDAWIVFPGLILLLTIMSIVGRGIPQIILVLGISGGIGGSRLIRSAVIAIKGSDNFLGSRGGWQHKMAFIHPTCPAQCYACRHHHVLDNRRRRNPEYCFSELPRIRSAPHDS